MAIKYKRIHFSRIGTLLLKQNLITPDEREAVLARQRTHGGRFGQVLFQVGCGQDCAELEEGVARALSSQYGIPRLPLDRYEIDREVVALVPERIAKRHCLMPVERMGLSLTVTMADPLDEAVVQELEAFTRCSVQVLIGLPSEIYQVIDAHY